MPLYLKAEVKMFLILQPKLVMTQYILTMEKACIFSSLIF